MRRTKLPSKWLVVGAMGSFLGTAFLIIALNSTVGRYGFHADYTISRYVGLEHWSAIVFFLSNIFVTILIGRYLFLLGAAWKMPKLFYVLTVIMAVMLVGLSAFPIGLFDVNGTTSIISWAHQITSRGMFITMLLIAMMIVACRRAGAVAHIANILFILFAVVFVVGFLTKAPWFLSHAMAYETAYLLGFMIAMALCDERPEHLLEMLEE